MSPGKQAAQGGRDLEILLLGDHVLHEIGRFEIGQRQFGGAADLVVHRLEEIVLGGRLGADGPGGRQRERGHRELFHWPPPRTVSMEVGSGSRGGRSLALAFFSVSISLTRMEGATALTGTLPLSAPQ